MLAHRLRRWPNIKPTLSGRLVFVGWVPSKQNICITFVQCRPNVFDVGPTLYKWYTNVLCLHIVTCGDRMTELIYIWDYFQRVTTIYWTEIAHFTCMAHDMDKKPISSHLSKYSYKETRKGASTRYWWSCLRGAHQLARTDRRTDSATTQYLHSLAGDGIQKLCHATIPCIRSCLSYFQTIFITFFPGQIFWTSTAVIWSPSIFSVKLICRLF